MKDARVAATEEPTIVVVGNETDLLTLGLVGRDETEAARVIPHRLLREMADGKARGGQLRLRQRPQEIRLVLPGIDALPQQPASGAVAGDARVVARRHRGRVPGARAVEQRSEL